jgi:acyl carrier protein
MSEATEIISEALDIDESLIVLDKYLIDIEQWDSVGILSLMAILDERKKIVLEIEKIQKLKTVQDLIKLIEEL